MPIQTYTIRLSERTPLSDKVSHFSFKMTDPVMPIYVPGQFITAQITHEGKALRRSYSIANREPSDTIEFAAGYVPNGPASELLFNMNTGDSLTITGPHGRLVLKEEPVSRYLFIGTSTGITPYRAMLSSLTEHCKMNPNLEVVIIQGVQYRADVLYEREFLTFANQHPNASFYTALSRESNEHLAPHEHRGYVQSVLETLSPHPDKDIVYLCGNPQMIDDTFERLKAVSFDPKNIRREKYLSR